MYDNVANAYLYQPYSLKDDSINHQNIYKINHAPAAFYFPD